jgi:inner membrane protein
LVGIDYVYAFNFHEHSSFGFAYTIAGSAVVISNIAISISILKDKEFPAFITFAHNSLHVVM